MMLRQVLGYGIVGLVQLALEWLLFVGATALGVSVIPANVLARIAGAALGFWLNGRFTFARSGAVLSKRSFVRFIVSWSVMTILGTTMVAWLERWGGLHAAWLGKPFLDIGLAGLGFLASKYWIYRPECPKGHL